MKKLLLNSLLISFMALTSAPTWALEAMVIVLEAPLISKPNTDGLVLQTLRKGDRLFVPNTNGDLDQLPEYLETFDRAGNTAYVAKRFLKIITNDEREAQLPIRFEGKDPTDYRLQEPIPSTYPFDNSQYLRASFSFSLGSNPEYPMDYNNPISGQKFSSESGGRFTVMNKVSFDRYDQYYFGIFGAVSSVLNSYNFKDNSLSAEKRSILRVGPYITFDTFKNEAYRLSVGGGFTYNFHKSTILMVGANGDQEERLYDGFSLSPLASLYFQRLDFVPYTDFILGADLNFYLPHTEKSNDQILLPELWKSQSPDQITSPFKAQVSIYLGVQLKY